VREEERGEARDEEGVLPVLYRAQAGEGKRRPRRWGEVGGAGAINGGGAVAVSVGEGERVGAVEGAA
jgi:hypothetical protein